MKSFYVDLYEKRFIFDQKTQPKFSNQYTDIDSDLRDYLKMINKDDLSPYQIHPEDDFTKNVCYAEGDKTWFEGHVEDNYLYRIDHLPKLMTRKNRASFNKNIVNEKNLMSKYGIRRFDLNLIDQTEVPKLFDQLESIIDNAWLPVSELLVKYEPPRQLTWWTDENLSNYRDSREFVSSAQKLGLATNWINTYSVITRCNVAKLAPPHTSMQIKVPSIIDAFTSPIFLPQLELKKPKHGIAIDLSKIGSKGWKEFVIRNIPISSLDFQVIKIPDSTRSEFDSGRESFKLYDQIIELYGDTG